MRRHSFALTLSAAFVLAGCSGGEGPWSGAMTQAVEVHLVNSVNPAFAGAIDPAVRDAQRMVVTVAQVRAHVDGAGWTTFGNVTSTADLLTLDEGRYQLLGFNQLPAGHVSEVRLYVTDAGENYVIDASGTRHDLVVPSGEASGITLALGMDALPCAGGQLTLGFDAHQSILVQSSGTAPEAWMLRPVVRLRALSLAGSCQPGSTEPQAPPPRDLCLTVSCGADQMCLNGACQAAPSVR